MKQARRIGIVAAAVVITTLGISSLFAQSRQQKPTGEQGKEVTLNGKIVDLQCYMTGKYPSKDETKCARDCIRSGVPAALETSNGLVIIGKGYRGAGFHIAKYAHATVELKGRLYEKQGVKYLDVDTIKGAKPSEAEDEGDDWPDEPEDPDEPDDPEDPREP